MYLCVCIYDLFSQVVKLNMLLSILAMICVVQHVYSYEPIKVYVEELAKEGINRVFTDGELAEYDGTEVG